MDNIDKKILEELQKNSSQTLSELSKKVGIDSIAKMAKEFGLGNSYQFGFEDEKKGYYF